MRFAAVEGGGTTWVVAIAENNPDNIVETATFPTTSPTETILSIKEWLKNKEFDSLGIASFGPIDAKESSPKFGFITSTPKPFWQQTDVIGLLGLRDELKGIPFKFDTDVNAPALAEYRLHNKPGSSSSAYITVGTGIGVGLIINGKSVKGLLHPEGGHILVMKKENDNFAGTCPFHGCCVEGMCNSIALSNRVGCSIHDLPSLPDDHEIWDICAYYLAQLCVNLILIASPEHISIGGGVLNRSSLFPKIRSHCLTLLNQYIENDNLKSINIDEYITPSYWGSQSGIVGAAYLAQLALEEKQT
eukprot:gene11221-15057_t